MVVEAGDESNGDIGVLVSHPDQPLCELLLRGIASVLSPAGYGIRICVTDGDTGRVDAVLRGFEHSPVRGVILCPHSLEHIEQAKVALARIDTKLVVVGGSIEDSSHCSIGIDDFRGGELAAQHLLSIGRTRLGFIRSATQCPYTAERWRGFASALARHSHEPGEVAEVSVHIEGENMDPAQLRSLLETRPDGLFCANDTIALSVMACLEHLGLAVPDDIAIVGFDNLASAEHASTPLTSLAQPAVRIGSAAATALLDEIEQGPLHVHTVARFIPGLMIRASTVTGKL